MKYVLSALAVSLALPVSADTLGPYTDLLVFGDSLSDPGNIDYVTGGAVPYSPIYPNGQFTNGDTWATQLGADFDSGTNFAYGDAKAIDTDADGDDGDPSNDNDFIPDFSDQIGLYGDSNLDLGDNPLTAIWFGGNDLRVLLDPDAPPAEPVALIESTVTEIVIGSNSLANPQLDDFLVFGLPDLGLIQSVVGDPEASAGATFPSTEFNKALSSTLAYFFDANPSINVSFFDTQGYFAELLADIDTLGITNITDACVVSDDPTTTDVNEFFFCGADQDSYAFFDGLHPTQKIHTALAEAVTDFVTSVPLPGGLSLALGGLVLLGGLAKRRKVATA